MPKQDRAADWDRWWRDRLSDPTTCNMFPYHATPMNREGPNPPVNSARPIDQIMIEYGLRTILCAGSGASQEPRALAEAGFDVTALDVSSMAMRAAESYEPGPEDYRHSFGLDVHRPDGRVSAVVGDLLDATVCPGPFDVILERRTVQTFPEDERPAALEALAARLSNVGIFMSHCNDELFPPSSHPTRLFHASEFWFLERGWTTWDGIPSTRVTGRVAWLVRSGSMK